MRSRTALVTVIATFTATIAVAPTAPVSACSCTDVGDLEGFGAADAVFTGRLVEVITPTGDTWSSADPERFVFDVDAIYKGTVGRVQRVVTARDGASCGLELSGPGPFLIFARTDAWEWELDDGELTSGLCSGTRPLAAGPVPLEFGQPVTPSAMPSTPPRDPDRATTALVVAVGRAVLTAVAIATAAFRRAGGAG